MKGDVEGSRSPKWAVWKRLDIRNNDGETYLARLRIIDTPWFGVYLHRIEGIDPQSDPHDHPWNFLSVVLAGGYTEQVWRMHRGSSEKMHFPYVRRWPPLTIHRMKAEGVAHRIIETEPHTLSLILRGKRSREWGFWNIDSFASPTERLGWTHWKDYEL